MLPEPSSIPDLSNIFQIKEKNTNKTFWIPGRKHSPGRRKGKGNHLQFRTDLFTKGKIDRGCETFSSNLLYISKICLKHGLRCYQWAHFPPLPCSSLHKSPLPCRASEQSPSSGPAWKCCFCLKRSKPPFYTHSPHRKHTSHYRAGWAEPRHFQQELVPPFIWRK